MLLGTAGSYCCLLQTSVKAEEPGRAPWWLLSFPLREPVRLTSGPHHEHVLLLTAWQVSMAAGQGHKAELNAVALRYMTLPLTDPETPWAGR